MRQHLLHYLFGVAICDTGEPEHHHVSDVFFILLWLLAGSLAVPLAQGRREEELHLLIGEHIHLIEDTVQLPAQLVVFLIQ
jgi:hypothetical protein